MNKSPTTISGKNNKKNVLEKPNSEKRKFLMPRLHSRLPKKLQMVATLNKPELKLIQPLPAANYTKIQTTWSLFNQPTRLKITLMPLQRQSTNQSRKPQKKLLLWLKTSFLEKNHSPNSLSTPTVQLRCSPKSTRLNLPNHS